MRSEWREVRASKVIDIIGGGTPSTRVLEYWDGPIPWISVKDFPDNTKYIYKTERTITKKGLEESSTKLLNTDDVIISARGTVGKIAMLSSPMAFNQTNYGLRGKSSLIQQHFLYYALKNSVDNIHRYTHGSVFDTITRRTFEEIYLKLPPLPTQKAIADTLSCLDAKIEVNNRIIKNLEQQAQAIFKSWFVDFEPFQDGEFVESELGLIPKGWKLLRFGDFIASRNEYGNNPKVPTYSVTNTGLHLRRDIFKRRLSSSETKNKVLYKGDLVFGMSRNILNWGIMKDRIGEVSSAYQVYEINQKVINSWYVELFIDQQIHYFYNLIRPASREGQGVDRGLLPTKYIYIPPIDWVDRYLDVIEPIKKGQKISEQQNTTLAALRNTLLPKLMSGEIEVPVEQD